MQRHKSNKFILPVKFGHAIRGWRGKAYPHLCPRISARFVIPKTIMKKKKIKALKCPLLSTK